MIYLSKLGGSFIGLAFMLYLVSLQTQSGLLFLILGILFGCYVINLAAARRTVKHLKLTPPETMRGREGEKINGTWQVENPSRHTLGLTEAASPWGKLFRLGALGPGDQAHLSPELIFPTRGVYPMHSLKLISSYPFGLVRYLKWLKISGEFIVYPRAYNCPPPRAAGFEPMVGGKFSGQNRSSSGDSFHGVRPFQSTDPVKLIHWKSSCKGLGLMVKEFDEELSGRVSFIVDGGDSQAPNGEPMFNWTARCLASLMLSALDEGHQVAYVDLADPHPLQVPPFADGSVVLERLARTQPSPDHLTRDKLRGAVAQLPRKSAICLVLTEVNEDVHAFINQDLAGDRRKISVYLPDTLRHSHDLSYGPVTYYGEEALQP